MSAEMQQSIDSGAQVLDLLFDGQEGVLTKDSVEVDVPTDAMPVLSLVSKVQYSVSSRG